ncbi:MAG TPA: RluA family pseudouridine synthase [Clostridia bacterium]|nr:RluA family pseudouridine synthase [Clostridia bacterium]
MASNPDFKFIIDEKHADKKIIDIMYKEMGMSGRFVRKLKKGKAVKLNGEKTSIYSRVQPGDLIDIYIPKEPCEDIPNEEIEVVVLFEDKCLLAVEKPAGLLVHPIKEDQNDTLSNGIASYMKSKNEEYIVRHVNRLDRDTSGVVLIAKNPYIHDQIAVQMNNGEVEKSYNAIVEGIMNKKSDCIDYPIGKPDILNIKREVMENGKPSKTIYDVVSESDDLSFLRIRLLTGRTHQIRVHMAHIGHPVLGDDLYGLSSELIGRQALHAGSYSFRHPVTKKIVEIKSELPKDMREVLKGKNFE